MARFNWWLGSTHLDHQVAINEQDSRLEQMDEAQGGVAEAVGKLFQLDRAQGRELARIEARIQVLSELLVEAGVIDGEQLQKRLAVALAAQAQTRAAAEATVRCASCREEVRADGTFYSEMGEICEVCYRA